MCKLEKSSFFGAKKKESLHQLIQLLLLSQTNGLDQPKHSRIRRHPQLPNHHYNIVTQPTTQTKKPSNQYAQDHFILQNRLNQPQKSNTVSLITKLKSWHRFHLKLCARDSCDSLLKIPSFVSLDSHRWEPITKD